MNAGQFRLWAIVALGLLLVQLTACDCNRAVVDEDAGQTRPGIMQACDCPASRKSCKQFRLSKQPVADGRQAIVLPHEQLDDDRPDLVCEDKVRLVVLSNEARRTIEGARDTGTDLVVCGSFSAGRDAHSGLPIFWACGAEEGR